MIMNRHLKRCSRFIRVTNEFFILFYFFFIPRCTAKSMLQATCQFAINRSKCRVNESWSTSFFRHRPFSFCSCWMNVGFDSTTFCMAISSHLFFLFPFRYSRWKDFLNVKTKNKTKGSPHMFVGPFRQVRQLRDAETSPMTTITSRLFFCCWNEVAGQLHVASENKRRVFSLLGFFKKSPKPLLNGMGRVKTQRETFAIWPSMISSLPLRFRVFCFLFFSFTRYRAASCPVLGRPLATLSKVFSPFFLFTCYTSTIPPLFFVLD